MDDLTSGYNIAEVLTLEPNFLNMLSFTYKETETYLRYVLNKYTTRQDRFDENLRTDINWIRRLTLSPDNAKEMLDALVINDELPYNIADLSSKFNTTLKDNYTTTLPNMTMRKVLYGLLQSIEPHQWKC